MNPDYQHDLDFSIEELEEGLDKLTRPAMRMLPRDSMELAMTQIVMTSAVRERMGVVRCGMFRVENPSTRPYRNRITGRTYTGLTQVLHKRGKKKSLHIA